MYVKPLRLISAYRRPGIWTLGSASEGWASGCGSISAEGSGGCGFSCVAVSVSVSGVLDVEARRLGRGLSLRSRRLDRDSDEALLLRLALRAEIDRPVRERLRSRLRLAVRSRLLCLKWPREGRRPVDALASASRDSKVVDRLMSLGRASRDRICSM